MSIRKEREIPRWKLIAILIMFVTLFIGIIDAYILIGPSHYMPNCSASRQLFRNYVGDSVLEYYSGHNAQYDDLTKSAKKLVIRDHMCYSDALITWAVGN